MQKKKPTATTPKSSSRRSILSDEIYSTIKEMIFEYRISPSSRVNIDALALQLKVSQTPVREALARLESDGLIAKTPLKGYTATNLLSMQEFDDLFQFRLLIEPWAAEQAAKKIDANGKKALKAEMHNTKKSLKFKTGDYFQDLTEHDARFHTLIAQLSGNKSIASAFERTHCHLHLFRLFMAHKLQLIDDHSRSQFIKDLFEQYYQTGSGQLALIEHDAIAKAILAGDSKTARTKMHSHIQSSLKRFSPSAQL